MLIKTNSPSVADQVIRILAPYDVMLKKNSSVLLEVTSGETEGQLRLLLQEALDKAKFDFIDDYVLLNGFSIWSFDKIIKELKLIKKNNVTNNISGYFYKFVVLNFTVDTADNRITKINMSNWTYADILKIFSSQPQDEWKTDVIRILDTITIKEIN